MVVHGIILYLTVLHGIVLMLASVHFILMFFLKFLIFGKMDRTRVAVITGFPQTKRCKNIEVCEFSTPPDMSGGCGKLPKIKVI